MASNNERAAKISNVSLSDVFFQALNAPKLVYGRSFAPDPAEGAYDAPRDLLVGWGTLIPHIATQGHSRSSASRSRHLWRLDS